MGRSAHRDGMKLPFLLLMRPEYPHRSTVAEPTD